MLMTANNEKACVHRTHTVQEEEEWMMDTRVIITMKEMIMMLREEEGGEEMIMTTIGTIEGMMSRPGDEEEEVA